MARMTNMAIPLREQAIRTSLDQTVEPLVEQLTVLAEVGSTNSYLLDRAGAINHAKICVTEAQTSGRGRRGNQWQSAANRNIMMSLSWTFEQWPDTITGLGLAIGMVAAERLNQNFNVDAKVKWPNDLMVANNKLGGILVDLAGESGGTCTVVIGLGLNVHQPDWSPEQSGSGIANYAWQDLYTLGVQPDRNELVAQFVGDWIRMLKEFEISGFVPWMAHWNRLSTYAGQQIRVGSDGKYVVGTMRGVDQSGALLLDSEDGELHTFSESSVSVRLVASDS